MGHCPPTLINPSTRSGETACTSSVHWIYLNRPILINLLTCFTSPFPWKSQKGFCPHFLSWASASWTTGVPSSWDQWVMNSLSSGVHPLIYWPSHPRKIKPLFTTPTEGTSLGLGSDTIVQPSWGSWGPRTEAVRIPATFLAPATTLNWPWTGTSERNSAILWYFWLSFRPFFP